MSQDGTASPSPLTRREFLARSASVLALSTLAATPGCSPEVLGALPSGEKARAALGQQQLVETLRKYALPRLTPPSTGYRALPLPSPTERG